MNRSMMTALLAIAAGLVMSSTASADHGAFYGYPWFGYGNNGPAAYALGNIPAPPYFALHPPVYYSHPIARPYGLSPFACPCDCNHGRRHAPARVFVNPFISQKEKPASPNKTNVAATPVRISNPFYVDKSRETELAGLE